MSFFSLGGCVTLFGLCLCLSDVDSMRTLKNVAVKPGGSVTIPCLYEEQYKANRKFWCTGYYWSSCSIVAYANSKGSTSVIDHPAQNLFTVELNPVSESGMHWCAAEIHSKLDDRDYLDLTVSQDPDLSVMESRVRGEEGGSITVQCLYSEAYQDTQKQWCRFRDEQCTTEGRTTTSQDSAMQLSDDGRSSFSVQMSGLKKSDAGWYWCRAGNLQVPVHISVSGNAPGLPEKQTEENKYQLSRGDTILILCIIAGLLLVLAVVGLVIWNLKQKQRGNKKFRDTPTDGCTDGCLVLPSVVGLSSTNKGCGHSLAPSASEPEIIYSSVRISQHPTVSPVPPNDNVIYSAVKVH